MHAAEELPGVSEGDMSIEDSQRKHGTTCGSPRRRKTHSEGISYKPHCGEVEMCRQAGRMGPIK